MDRYSQEYFSELINCPQSSPILIYLDPNKPCFLFTDASKYCWGATLYQHTSDFGPDNLQNLDHIKLISGTFSKTQCNYGALVREAFATHICQKT